MSEIYILCPDTDRPVATGLRTDSHSFASLPEVPIRTRCPHCGSEHIWWISEGERRGVVLGSDAPVSAAALPATGTLPQRRVG